MAEEAPSKWIGLEAQRINKDADHAVIEFVMRSGCMKSAAA
jgi:hypothetical protein